jgi:NADPH:quinone reductase-like Zn-dependent oxidoreductase
MKAIVYTKYGSPDVLQLSEVEKPAPRDDEVLIKIHAASINAGHYLWPVGCGRQRFALGRMPSLGGLTNESREVFL